MKIKLFDRYQHYYLDKIWENASAGKDVPAQLQRYIDLVEGEIETDLFIRTLHEKLSEHPAVDPDHGQWRTWGFVVPFHGQPEDIYTGINDDTMDAEYAQALAFEIHETGAILICVEKREKVLPSSAINDKLMDRAKEMAEREERELNRKDYAILKDEVTAALLKTAPVRRSRIYVMLNQMDMIVFTSSQKAAEETNALIRQALSSLPTVPAYTNEVALQEFFKKVMKRDKEVCSTFTPGTTVKLRNDEGEVVTVKDGDINDERFTGMLKQGFRPTEIELQMRCTLPGMEHIWVKMNHKGDIKSFSTSAEADGDEFDTQYERGEAGFQSRMAELWVLRKAICAFNDEMAQTGVMVKRDQVAEMEDGDEIAVEKDAKQKAKAKPAEPEEEQETEDDDAWEDDATYDDDDI